MRTFWGTLLFGVIGLAVAVQMGRAIFPIMNEYRDEVEKFLSKQLSVDISIGEIRGVWHGLRPKLALADLAVRNREDGSVIFVIETVEAEISLLSSLRDWRLAFRQLSFHGLQVTFLQNSAGRWQVRGLPNTRAKTLAASGDPIIDDPLDIFLFGRRVNLLDTQMTVEFRSDLHANITIPTIRLENDADFHRLFADFQVDSGSQVLSLIVEGVGDPRDELDFNAQGYLKLDHFPSEQVLAALGVGSDILVKSDLADRVSQWHEQGRVNLDMWFSGTAQKGLNWFGSMAVEGIPLIPPDGVVWPDTLKGDFRGQWDSKGGWQMSLSNTEVQWPDFLAPPLNAMLLGKLDQSSEVRFDQIDLGAWHRVLNRAGLMPPAIKGVFDDLQPHGLLSQVQIQSRSAEQGYFFLRAKVANGGVHPWAGVPAIDQVNGVVEASAFDGHVMLNSENGFSLNFPRVYHQPLKFAQAKGDVRWSVNMADKHIGISSGLLHVTRQDAVAQGHFNLRLPFSPSPGDEPEMTLVIGVEKGFAELHRTLVPYTVPEHLYEWLGRSIKSGDLRDGAFIYHGTLMSDSSLARVLQLSVLAEHAEIEFDPQWPPLSNASGRLLLDDHRFQVSAMSGSMMGVQISNGQVALSRIGAEAIPAVAINGNIKGDSGTAMALLKASPVSAILGEEIGSWGVSGPMSGEVKLLVPLTANSATLGQQSIQLRLEHNQLVIPRVDMTLTNLHGNFTYTHDEGVHIDAINGRLWGKPMQASVTTEAQQGNHSEVIVAFAGKVDVENLQQWTARPELRFLSGVSQMRGTLSVPVRSSKPIILSAQSNLRGVEVNLPLPLGKNKSESASFALEMEIQQSDKGLQQTYRFDYRHQGRARALVRQTAGVLDGVSVMMGNQKPVLRPGKIWLQGKIDEGDALEWYDSITEYLGYLGENELAGVSDEHIDLGATDPFTEAAMLPLEGQLHWQQLKVKSLPFADVTLAIKQQPERWQFTLSGPDIVGEVIYRDENHPIELDLQHVHIRDQGPGVSEDNTTGLIGGAEPAGEALIAPPSAMASIDLLSLPSAAVKIASWSVSDRDMGSLEFDLYPVTGGVAAVNLRANIDHLTIAGRGRGGAELLWLRSDSGDMTYFSGLAKTADVSDVLQSWQMDKALTSKTAQFDLQIQWPGAPDFISLENLSGVVGLEILRGRFIRGAEAGENPLVKLVGLLNFDTLARRLRLDFSDLHPTGMGYESVHGHLLFKQGLIEISDPLQVDMPASQLQMVGRVDIPNQKIDAQLVATLPLAGDLTFAAALTGGIPMAVGVYVVGKLFKRQMDQVSSLRYNIKGTWDDPDVSLEKVFENNPEFPRSSPTGVIAEPQQAPASPIESDSDTLPQ